MWIRIIFSMWIIMLLTAVPLYTWIFYTTVRLYKY